MFTDSRGECEVVRPEIQTRDNPRFSASKLLESAKVKLLNACMEPSTMSAYSNIWLSFQLFIICILGTKLAWPVQVDVVASYMAVFHKKGVKRFQ